MPVDDTLTLLWRGAAHYQLCCRGQVLVIDPLFTRLPGDEPHLVETRESLEKIDYLLLTHGHLDHSWDVPFLATRYRPEIYGPRACLADVRRMWRPWRRGFDRSKWHALETVKGETFSFVDIDVTPYPIGTEEIDWWFMRDMTLRPLRHGRPRTLWDGLHWLSHHVLGNCFAFHFLVHSIGKTMLYFGNLTDEVAELHPIDHVDVLAIPYCPASPKWVQQTQHLLDRFSPQVALVHHFDNFMNPFTRARYIDLGEYQTALRDRCPSTKLCFSKFGREVPFVSLVG